MGKSADEQFRTGSMSIADYHRASEIERRERRVEMDRREEKLRQARQEKR